MLVARVKLGAYGDEVIDRANIAVPGFNQVDVVIYTQGAKKIVY
jgi:hypothetical protein